MDMKRRDVLLGGGGIAATLAVGGLASPNYALAQTQQPPSRWDREADVVVIGAGATGLPAAIVAREAGSSVILVEAEAGHRRSRDHQRRQCAAWRRHQRAAAIRHRGLAGSVVPRPDRLVGGRTERLSRLSLQRPRDHPRLCRQQRADLRMAGRAWRGVHRQGAGCTRRQLGRQFGAARDALRGRATGRWCRPASRPTRRCRRPGHRATA